jgi:centrosomal protein CEP104
MVLSMLVADHGLLSSKGVPRGGDLIRFGVQYKAHTHANGELREAAKQLATEIYKVDGPRIEEHLTHLRPKQLEEYKAAFEAANEEEAGGGAAA